MNNSDMISFPAEKTTSNSAAAFIIRVDDPDRSEQSRARPADLIDAEYFIPELTQHMTAVWGS